MRCIGISLSLLALLLLLLLLLLQQLLLQLSLLPVLLLISALTHPLLSTNGEQWRLLLQLQSNSLQQQQ